MFRFPYFGYQYNNPYYRYYPKYNNYYNHINTNNSNTQSLSREISSTTSQNASSNTTKDSRSINSSISTEQALFEIFGIKLFLDDIIILCLLFFLYQENVKDEMLYIILFLLLFA